MDKPKAITAAAHKLARPVKWYADRSEAFLADGAGRDLAEGRAVVEGAQAPGQFLNQGLVPKLVNKLHRPGSGER